MKLSPALTLKIGRASLLAKQNSPHILFGLGVVGMIGTAVTASRATLKLDETLEAAQKKMKAGKILSLTPTADYNEEDLQKDTAYIYIQTGVKIAKLYTPTLVLGVVSIACLTKSHQILTERNAALTAGYIALEKAFDSYRERVREELGEEKERELRHDLVAEDPKDPKSALKSGPASASVYAKFFDEANINYEHHPDINAVFLRAQQNYANNLLRTRGHVFLNEVYDMLGLDRTEAGQFVGWLNDGDGDGYIDFGIFRNEPGARDFVNGREAAILLDFNVDGPIHTSLRRRS